MGIMMGITDKRLASPPGHTFQLVAWYRLSAHVRIFPGKPGNSDTIDYSPYICIRIPSDTLVCDMSQW